MSSNPQDQGKDPAAVLIDCQDVWKIFGAKAATALAAVKQQALSKQQVLKRFDCVVGVAGADLEVRRGEIFCIMGLSGSGKSTLVRMLNRLIDPTAGKILVKGEDLLAMNGAELRRIRAHDIGMVFQSVALLPQRTVLSNTAFNLEVQGVPKAERNRIASEALAKVGLSDWLERYPRQLSGGMQQRVGIARAIAADPEIILMDEPFSALDPLLRRQLQDEFRSLIKGLGKSAVFITHDLDEAIRIGDRIAIMKDGVMLQTGIAEDIVREPANDYVARFVAGISTLNLLKARSVMAAATVPRADLPRIDAEAGCRQLIDQLLAAPSKAVAVERDGALLGVVTPESLLAGLRGTEHVPEATPVP